MSFFTLPPEINSLRMFLGAGSAPMLEAAAAWNGLAAELGTAAQSFQSVISNLAGQAWQGPASAAMAAAAAPYAGWLSAAASQSLGASTQAQAVASAFEAARAATIHPGAVDQNRNAFVNLVMSNLFGQNAPLIALAESIYEEMWAADVTAMAGYYSNAAAAAAQVVPWQNVLQTFPALASGVAGGVSAVAHGGGAVGTGDAAAGGAAPAVAGPTGAAAAAGGGGGSAGGVGSTDAGLAPASYTSAGDPGAGAASYTGATAGATDVSGATAAAASPGVAGAGLGSFAMAPMMMAGLARAGLLNDGPGMSAPPVPKAAEAEEEAAVEAEATEAEVTEAAEVQEVVPAMGVLQGTAGAAAAAAAPGEARKAAQISTATGIPASGLRVVASAEAAESEEAAEAEEAVATLRPRIAAGEFHRQPAQEESQEEEAPRLQIQGG